VYLAARERHLEGITEKLRSGVNGKVREAIQQSIARILVGTDGSLTIEARTGGLLGWKDTSVMWGTGKTRPFLRPLRFPPLAGSGS
jgi:hypothetical protein